MQNVEKQNVVEALVKAMALGRSQAKLATTIGVSDALLSNMRSNKWTSISDEKWRKVAKFLGVKLSDAGAELDLVHFKPWGLYKTPNFIKITRICSHSQAKSLFKAVSGYAGAGKTTALKHYYATTENCFYVECDEYLTRKVFLQLVAKSLGLDLGLTSIDELMRTICETLNGYKKPLLIIDEADKLKDSVLGLIKSIYNKTEGNCGILIAGVDYLRDRIEKGVTKHKIGFDELFSRFGRQFETLKRPELSVIEHICNDMNIDSREVISTIANQSVDFRQVKAMVESYHYQQNKEVIHG